CWRVSVRGSGPHTPPRVAGAGGRARHLGRAVRTGGVLVRGVVPRREQPANLGLVSKGRRNPVLHRAWPPDSFPLFAGRSLALLGSRWAGSPYVRPITPRCRRG